MYTSEILCALVYIQFIYKTSSIPTKYNDWDIIDFEVDISSQTGSETPVQNMGRLLNATLNNEEVSACEFISLVGFYTSGTLGRVYLGCEDDFTYRRNGKIHMFFAAKKSDSNVDKACLDHEVQKVNHEIHKWMNAMDINPEHFIHVIGATIRPGQNLVVGSFQYPEEDNPRFTDCEGAGLFNWRYGMRKEIHECFIKIPANMRENISLVSYWAGCGNPTLLFLSALPVSQKTVSGLQYVLDFVYQCHKSRTPKTLARSLSSTSLTCPKAITANILSTVDTISTETNSKLPTATQTIKATARPDVPVMDNAGWKTREKHTTYSRDCIGFKQYNSFTLLLFTFSYCLF